MHIGADRAKQLLEYLSKLRYASFEYTLILLQWRTGMRMGAARSFDVDDYDREDARLRLEHRPTTDTPLKNKEGGERYITLAEPTCVVIDDWLEYKRPNVIDDFERALS